MTDIETIKGDLRKLRKVTHAIEALMKMRETHEKRLVYLSGLPPSKETVEEIEKIETVLKGLNIEDYIGRATTLEERYVSAIDKLDPLDKKIVVDSFFNGKAYWKIGRDIGYTEAGIRKRLDKIYKQIQSNM